MKRSLPLIAAFVAILSLTACGGGSSQADAPSGETPAALSKVDISIGTGAEAVAPKSVKVHYTGWLYSSTATGNKGTQFETSVGGTPYPFKLGVNASIPGFEQGVIGMKVGGKRTVIIPANLAYGANGNPPKIPRNSGLVFEVELMEAL
jgi:FKBP-type peptidyl-prolyl cis-trans isomerase FkpA